MTVIQRIQRLCDARDMSISALEKKLGFANKSLYERDTPLNIRSDRLLAIAQFFNVSTDWLLTGNEESAQFPLSEEEKSLILMYRNLTAEGKELLIKSCNMYAEAGFVKRAADSNKMKIAKAVLDAIV